MAFTSVGILLLLVLLILIWYFYFFVKRKTLYKLASQFSGPTPLPIIGNALKFIVPIKDITDIVLMGAACYKSPARLWMGPYLVIFVYDPEDTRIILNSPHALAKLPYLYNILESLTGHGLLTSPVDEWKRNRRLMSPIFNNKSIENFFDIFHSYSKLMVESLQTETYKNSFDIKEYLSKFAMHIGMNTLLDYSVNEGDLNGSHILITWSQTLFHAIACRATRIWYLSDFIFNMSSEGKKTIKVKKQYDAFIHSVIEKWQQGISAKKYTNDNKGYPTSELSRPRKLVEHLMSTPDGKRKFTTEELKGEVNTIIVAGQETTPSAVGFTLILLALHPDIQEKVYEEITQVLGPKEDLKYENLKEMEYLDRVIKESLRLFPPVGGIARYAEKEIYLKNHTIPANTPIIIGIFPLHRDPNIWPNPNKFDPERFLPEEEAKRDLYSWLPFSGGPRNCIAERFGWVATKIALCNIIRKYKVTTEYNSVEDIHLTFTFKMDPTDGFKIGLMAR